MLCSQPDPTQQCKAATDHCPLGQWGEACRRWEGRCRLSLAATEPVGPASKTLVPALPHCRSVFLSAYCVRVVVVVMVVVLLGTTAHGPCRFAAWPTHVTDAQRAHKARVIHCVTHTSVLHHIHITSPWMVHITSPSDTHGTHTARLAQRQAALDGRGGRRGKLQRTVRCGK